MTAATFACAVSTARSGHEALGEALAELERRLGGQTPDLVIAFATHHYGEKLETFGPEIARSLGPQAIAGCTAEGVLGDGREVEGQPGLVLWAAHLPGTRVESFQAQAKPHGGTCRYSGCPDLADGHGKSLLTLVDGYSFPIVDFLGDLGRHVPGLAVQGGLASGAFGPGQTLFFTPDGVEVEGMQGVLFEGPHTPLAVVSQGVRPVGKPYVITECERNEIKRLSGRPALEVFMEAVTSMNAADQRLFHQGQFIGLAVDPKKSTFQRGDLLARAVMGVNHQARSFSVSDFVRRGQTLQLSVRDPGTAGSDLTKLIVQAQAERAAKSALIFTCAGRGRRMFSDPDHDVRHVLDGCGEPIPTAGFFAGSEIGPVGGQNLLHSFTASVALFPGA